MKAKELLEVKLYISYNLLPDRSEQSASCPSYVGKSTQYHTG